MEGYSPDRGEVSKPYKDTRIKTRGEKGPEVMKKPPEK